MGFDFGEVKPIFGQIKAVEWSAPQYATSPRRPFFFYVHGQPNENSTLAIDVTDFDPNNTWESLKSHNDLEDMRDDIGIGGSFSEFVDYLIASLKSEDVKLVLEGHSKSGGVVSAKLIAQKAKGLPRISISLHRLSDDAAIDVMSNLSLELYESFKSKHDLFIKEQERCCHLTRVISAEKEKNEDIQRQLEGLLYSKRKKLHKTTDKSNSDTMSGSILQESSDKPEAQNPVSSKVNRVVPAYRRAKVRGVLLHDTEEAEN